MLKIKLKYKLSHKRRSYCQSANSILIQEHFKPPLRRSHPLECYILSEVNLQQRRLAVTYRPRALPPVGVQTERESL